MGHGGVAGGLRNAYPGIRQGGSDPWNPVRSPSALVCPGALGQSDQNRSDPRFGRIADLFPHRLTSLCSLRLIQCSQEGAEYNWFFYYFYYTIIISHRAFSDSLCGHLPASFCLVHPWLPIACYYCHSPPTPPDTVPTVCTSIWISIISKAQNTISNITYHFL